MPLKKKYTSLAEPRDWYDRAGKKNVTQWGTGGSRNTKRSLQKGVAHPEGFSGRTLGGKKK